MTEVILSPDQSAVVVKSPGAMVTVEGELAGVDLRRVVTNITIAGGISYSGAAIPDGSVSYAKLAPDVLSAFVTPSALTSALASYVTSSALATTLGGYVTTAGLSSALASYATTSALASAIATEVTNRDNAIAAAIATEVTNRNNAITAALASYVTNSALTAALASYVTNASLATTLGSYALTSAIPVAATATPAALGTPAVGVATKYAREDHVHQLPTIPAPSSTIPAALGTAAVGTGTTYARADHVHQLPTIPAASSTTPNAVGTAAVGTSANYAREDHVHAHGNQAAGGSMHAVVTTSVNGFMSAADKSKLDGIAAGATVGPSPSSATPTSLGTAAPGVAAPYAREDHVHPMLTFAQVNTIVAGANAAISINGQNLIGVGTLRATQGLFGGLTTSTAGVHIRSLATDITPTQFGVHDLVIGRDATTDVSSGALFMRWYESGVAGFIGSLQPGAAWRPLIIGASNTYTINSFGGYNCRLPGVLTQDLTIRSDAKFSWANSTDVSVAADTELSRKAAGVATVPFMATSPDGASLTSSATLTPAAHAGGIHDNLGAAAAVTATLWSSPTKNQVVGFMKTDAQRFQIQAPGGVTIRIGNNVSASGGFIRLGSADATTGTTIMLRAVSSTVWQCIFSHGSYTVDS